MKIIYGQSYEMNNLVSRSGKFSVDEFQNIGVEMSKYLNNKAIDNGEYVITTTKTIEDEGKVMDVEVLMPLHEPIKVNEPYFFKEKIKIVNALYMKVSDINMMQEGMNELNRHIIEHHLQPVTSAYLIQTKQDGRPCTEIYIGISQNIL